MEEKQPMEGAPVEQEAPQEEMPQDPMMDGKGGSGSALIALVVIVLVILLGAFFIFGDKLPGGPKTDADLEEQFEATQANNDEEVQAIRATSESTAVADIESDLNNSDFSELDSELDAVDEEFGN